ncbi:type VII secretion protein EccCb [Micromonospora yasonensis]|uniref:type VII secretion protein EccCb n=1 Tax=Micromonospora yasonensis TaxID=1128667 RepID=UPI0022308964|nr:type VII secretion protein EccCb [Micromonospora yasonensis]MCW3842884.1 type VII secretion protein EccCb [Micromonospora yasonensis]
MSAWTRTSPASSRLSVARATLPAGALELASHAAVPVAVDPGFLHLLRVNFFLDPPAVLGYPVEAELLTSPLFRELGDGLYEIDPALRDRLLVSLLTRFGNARLTRVATLLEQYTDHGAPWRALPELEHAQRLTALSIIEPSRATEWLDQAQRVPAGDGQLGREWFVAMRDRLEQQPPVSANLNQELADVLGRARAGTEDGRIAAVHQLGQLGLLPGADVATIARALHELADGTPPPVAAVVRDVLDTLVLLVPAPSVTGDERDATAQHQDEVSLPDLLGIRDVRHPDLRRLRRRRGVRDRLRAPIGVGPGREPVELDLKEPAQEGMGPHGLVVGATGSGKSELLRTIVLGLAATHSPDLLNVVLVDFWSGAVFAPLAGLPHVAAVVTGLGEVPALLDRLAEALTGELVRRQELLRRAGNFVSVRDYEEARTRGDRLAPLPSLLIVCDEFTELLTAKPDFIEVFVQIGRVGRSLGVHLLLASQRLEEGPLRGLDGYLSYRIGLRTFTAHESRMVLGVPDAHDLGRPGDGYLRAGTDPLVRFKAAYVSGPYHAPAPRSWEDVLSAPGRPRRPPTVAEVLVDALAGQGPPAHQIWLPPLTASPSVDALAGPLAVYPARGLTVQDVLLRGALRVPVGLADKPYEQRQDVLWLDLYGGNGHVAVVGGPGSGKSTALRTLITSLALSHTPAEVQVYCLDLGGGQLSTLRGLPHVGGVAGRADSAAIRRTVGEMATLLDNRRRSFPAAGTDMAAYRRRLAVGTVDDPFGDVFLVVDGWDRLRSEYDDLEQALTLIALHGLPCGIHLVAATGRWTDLRSVIRDSFGTRLELRLRDPGDSAISRRAAANVPTARPGHGITSDALHFLIAPPAPVDGDPADLVDRVAAAWAGPPAPRVRMLPAVVPFSAIEDVRDEGRPWALPIGLAEADLRPVTVDFEADPHVLVFGDAGSGKSTFLRLLATTIAARFTPAQARLVIVDYRRSLLDAVPTEHLLSYCGSSTQTSDLQEVAHAMRNRLPGPDVTPEQLRDRSWWRGPECFVLVDDYELVAMSSANPLAPLVDLLPAARDIGLHLILTRRGGGAARAMYEPVIQRLRELAGPGLILSGEPGEGGLLGNVRPSTQPPGRGWLVTQGDGARLVQLALPPDAP